MSAGSGMIYTGRVLHSAGANTTDDIWRRGLHISYVLGWLTPEEAGPIGVPEVEARRLSPLAQRLLGFLSNTGPTAHQAAFPELSEREREILALLSADRSNHEIAQQLSLSLKTVRNHVSNILNKIGADDRHAAARRARDAGLNA